jgi:hypothetical protein
MMDVIVKIAGREALPVWTIPYITSWDISADMLLKRLVAPNYNNEPTFPDAFNLDSYGDPHSIPSIWWFDTETRISMLEYELTDKKISQYKKLDKWHKRSVEIIMQSTGCYIWLDEFKKWLECYNNYDNEILMKPTDNDRGFTTYRIELFLNPPLPPEHALYFKNTEIMESTHFPRSQLITNNSVDEQTAIATVVMGENPKPWLAADHEEKLAALFEPMPVEALAKMFPTDILYSAKQWKIWTERAGRNGLKEARQGRAMFNPYKAGKWFVHNGAEGWDDARLNKVLAKNLPVRSRDKEYLVTGELD